MGFIRIFYRVLDTSQKKKFTFDHSYWSHDGFIVNKNGVCVPDGAASRYVSQEKVFSDLGTGILKNAFDGYNCSLFAYGQTGSGKSYSVVGYGENKSVFFFYFKVIFTHDSYLINFLLFIFERDAFTLILMLFLCIFRFYK